MEPSKNAQPGYATASAISGDESKTVSTGTQTNASSEYLIMEVKRLVDETLRLHLRGNLQPLQKNEKEERDIEEWGIASIPPEHHDKSSWQDEWHWKEFDNVHMGNMQLLTAPFCRLLDETVKPEYLREMVNHKYIKEPADNIDGGNPFNNDFFKNQNISFTRIISHWFIKADNPKISTFLRALYDLGLLEINEVQKVYDMGIKSVKYKV